MNITERGAQYHLRAEQKFRRLSVASRDPEVSRIHAEMADGHADALRRKRADAT